jgi:hypothetical protein
VRQNQPVDPVDNFAHLSTDLSTSHVVTTPPYAGRKLLTLPYIAVEVASAPAIHNVIHISTGSTTTTT